jgi:hypothetical protein
VERAYVGRGRLGGTRGPGRAPAAANVHPVLGLGQLVGNRAVAGLVSASVQRETAAGGGAEAKPDAAGPATPPKKQPSRPKKGRKPPKPSNKTEDSRGEAPGGGTEGELGEAPRQAPVAEGAADSFLGHLTTAAPSTFTAALATVSGGVGRAFEGHRRHAAQQLSERPLPTGVTGGAEPDKAIEPAPVRDPSAVVDANAAGDDPAGADHVGNAGRQALDALRGEGDLPAPPVAQHVRPPEAEGTLPHAAVDGEAPMLQLPAAPAIKPGIQAKLDRGMGPELRASLAGISDRYASSESKHLASMRRAGSETKATLARATSDTSGKQQQIRSSVTAEIQEHRAAFHEERESLISGHEQEVQAAASEVRSQATADLHQAAKEQAETEAASQQPAQGDFWDKAKSVGSSIVGGVKSVGSAIASAVGGLIAKAKAKIVGLFAELASRIKAKVQAAVDAVKSAASKVASATMAALRKGRDLVTSLAASLKAFAVKCWEKGVAALKAAWNAVASAAKAAFNKATGFVKKVADGAKKLAFIVKTVASKFLSFLARAIKDPQGTIFDPLKAKLEPYIAKIPGAAHEKINEHKSDITKDEATPAPAMQRLRIQREEAGQQQVPQPRLRESTWSGVWRHLGLLLSRFASDWWRSLFILIAKIILWPVTVASEIAELWPGLVSAYHQLMEGQWSDLIDTVFSNARKGMDILGTLVAGIGAWALIFGLVGGPIDAVVLGAYLQISQGILGADIVVSVLTIIERSIQASRDGRNEEKRNEDFSAIASSGIGAVVCGVLMLLGAAASKFAKVIRGWTAIPGLAEGAGEGAGAAKAAGTADVKPPERALTPGDEAKGKIGDPTRTDVGAATGSEPRPHEWPYQNPPNMEVVPSGQALNLKGLNPKLKYIWVVDADYNFKFAPERQNPADFMKPADPSKALILKHGDLNPGEGGVCRGPARAGGELKYDPNQGEWVLNNDSSYTFRRVDADGNPLPWAPADSIEGVRDHLVQGGTDPDNLVTQDVLAAQRRQAAARAGK